MRCFGSLKLYAPCVLRLVPSIATMLMVIGCNRYQPLPAITLIFVLAPGQNVSEADLAVNSSLPIHVSAKTLACDGSADYKEYHASTPVHIFNERGNLIGSGRLGPGKIIKVSRSLNGIKLYRGCRFKSVIRLDEGARIYKMDIADGKYKDYLHASQMRALGGVVLIDLD